MKLRRLISIGSVMVLSVYSLLAIYSPQIADAAAPYTCTWTGATNNNFNTAGNWSGCNSAAPQPTDNDNLIFDNTSLSSAETLTNDISGLQVGSMTFQGTNANYYQFTLTGNAMTIGGGISLAGQDEPTIDNNLTLSAAQSITAASYNTLHLGDSNTSPTLNLNGFDLSIGSGLDDPAAEIYSTISGSNNIDVLNGANLLLDANSSSWTGSLNVASGGYVEDGNVGGLGAASNNDTVASGGSLAFCDLNNGSVPQNISIGGNGLNSGGALDTYTGCGFNGGGGGGGGSSTAPAQVTLTGTITLTSNAVFNSTDTSTITGPLSGNYTLTAAPAMFGTLVIDSSNNTSQTPNGSYEAPTITTNYTANSPSTTIYIGKNQTGVVDGTYGDTTVDNGGTLKGTGTVGALYVVVGGIVAPGDSGTGCLSASGTIFEGGTYQEAIGGTTACTDYDQLDVTGAVTLDDDNTPPNQGILQVSLVNGFKPKKGQTFDILKNGSGSAISDTFANLPAGSTITVDGYVFEISYTGGSGNDVVLTVKNVPSAPDTGFGLISTNPFAVLGATTVSALAILVVVRLYRKPSTARK